MGPVDPTTAAAASDDRLSQPTSHSTPSAPGLFPQQPPPKPAAIGVGPFPGIAMQEVGPGNFAITATAIDKRSNNPITPVYPQRRTQDNNDDYDSENGEDAQQQRQRQRHSRFLSPDNSTSEASRRSVQDELEDISHIVPRYKFPIPRIADTTEPDYNVYSANFGKEGEHLDQPRNMIFHLNDNSTIDAQNIHKL